jgi:CheY-like chemotaxis protein
MDGIEATAEIVKLGTGTPIVAMTANSTPGQREEYIERGMVDCIGTPFTTQELLACLMNYIAPKGKKVEEGILQPQDEEKLRLKFINSFVRDNKTKYNDIEAAIKAGDIKLAHRLAHTLKSNAALVDKKRLQKAAEEVESLLSDEENRMNIYAMNSLETELNAALKEFEPLIAQDAAPAASNKSLNKEQTQELLGVLGALLDGGNPDCLKLLGDLRNVPGSEELAQQIEYFEFDLAMKTLAQLQKNIMGTDHAMDA